MSDRFKNTSVTVDVVPGDKIRFKEFMKQELHLYNTLVEGLGSRARTFPEVLLGLHKDWENLWDALALEGKGVKAWERAAPDAKLPENLEPHRKMLVGRDKHGKRFLDERMSNIMALAATPAIVHPLVRRNMANMMLEFYKDQAGKLIQRNDEAMGDEDLYSKPIDLLVKQDMVTKRHLQMPRQSLNDVRWIKEKDLTEIYHPYSENPLKVPGHDLESNNHWNYLILHQQPSVEVVPSDPWVLDIQHSSVSYQIKYQDVEQPRTGRIFATMKRRDY